VLLLFLSLAQTHRSLRVLALLVALLLSPASLEKTPETVIAHPPMFLASVSQKFSCPIKHVEKAKEIAPIMLE
jgi:hypothetical protein